MEPGVNTSAPASTPAAEEPAAAKPATTNTGGRRG